jgi:hypothetical protein
MSKPINLTVIGVIHVPEVMGAAGEGFRIRVSHEDVMRWDVK